MRIGAFCFQIAAPVPASAPGQHRGRKHRLLTNHLAAYKKGVGDPLISLGFYKGWMGQGAL